MTYEAKMTAKLGMRGTIECRNARGDVIKTIEFSGGVPLDRLGLSVDQAKKLVEQQEGANGRQQ